LLNYTDELLKWNNKDLLEK